MRAHARATATLMSVDGVSGSAVMRAATRLASADRGDRAGISCWDAPGIFGDLDAGDPDVEKAIRAEKGEVFHRARG